MRLVHAVVAGGLLLSACTFEPNPVVFSEKDGGGPPVRDTGVFMVRDAGGDAGVPDGGDIAPDAAQLPDGGDPNEIDGGFDNRPPVLRRLRNQSALPWDTIPLHADVQDPDGDPLRFEWNLTPPANAATGLGPFPGPSRTATTADVELHVSIPGEYAILLTVDDGGFVRTASATVTVLPFTQVALEQDDEVETVLVSPWRGTLWIGTKGKGLHRLEAGAAPPANDIGCVGDAKINALAETTTGTLGVAAEDGMTIFDGQCRPRINPQFTKLRATVVAENDRDFYTAGDPDVALFDSRLGTFQSFRLNFAGDKQKFRGAARDGAGLFWFASDAADPEDGIAGSLPPPNATAPRVDIYPNLDDDPRAIRAGMGRELWIVGDNGIAFIASTQNPASVQRFSAGAGLPEAFDGTVEDAAPAADGDVWFAGKDGIARFKRNIGEIVVIFAGTYGLPADGEMRGIAVDDNPARVRTVYTGGKAGLWSVHAPRP